MTNKFEVAIVARDEFTKPLTAFTKRTREAFGEAGKSARTTGKAWRQVGQDIEDAVDISRRPEPNSKSPQGRPGGGAVPSFNSAVPRALVAGADAAGMLGKNGASGLLGAAAGGSILGAGVAAAGAVSSAVNKNIATARAARVYGLDPMNLQSWAGAAEVAGYSRESMVNAMTNMAQLMYGAEHRPNEYVRQRMVLKKMFNMEPGVNARGADMPMIAMANVLPSLTPGQRRTVGAELGIDDNTLDFLSRGWGFVRQKHTEAQQTKGLVLSNEELQRAEGAGDQRAGVATKVEGLVNQLADKATGLISDLVNSRSTPAKPANSGASAPAQIDVNVQVHGLPPGASASATAKQRDGDTSRPRVSTNRAGNTP